jgi:hypothetical protein
MCAMRIVNLSRELYHRAAEQRNELAALQSIELHPLPPARVSP